MKVSTLSIIIVIFVIGFIIGVLLTSKVIKERQLDDSTEFIVTKVDLDESQNYIFLLKETKYGYVNLFFIDSIMHYHIGDTIRVNFSEK